LIPVVASRNGGKILLSPQELSQWNAVEGALADHCIVKVEALCDEGLEHTYVLAFPSKKRVEGFLGDLSSVAHLKSVIEIPSQEIGILAPKWIIFKVSKYEGGARYSMAEKWMGVQEVLV